MTRRIALLLFAVLLGALFAALAQWTNAPHQPGPLGEEAGDSRPPRFTSFEGEAMYTVIQVTLPEGPEARAAADEVFEIFREEDARLSEWKETSPLSEVNREAGVRAVSVPGDLLEVVERGVAIGDLTGGAFDITWAALWGLWDFKAASPRVPEAAEIARRVALVDYREIQVDRGAGTLFLPRAGMKIGLGGIAKGYALDRARAALTARGVRDFLILGGGQVLAGGSRGDRPWRVGIRNPRGEPSDFFETLVVSDLSVSTSGDYESYFELDGTRYHHILDPRTGSPSRGLRSATVVSADATLADALSTALMVLGPERGLSLADSLPGVEALLVDSEGQVLLTHGMPALLQAP